MKHWTALSHIVLVLLLSVSGASVLYAQTDTPIIKKDSISPDDLKQVNQIPLPSALKVTFPTHKADFHLPRPTSSIMGMQLRQPNVSFARETNPRLSFYGSRSENFNIIGQPVPVHELSKTLHLGYKITDELTFNASGMIGYTSLPLTIAADQTFDAYAGLTYTPSEKLAIGGGVSVGKFVNSGYINPSAFIRYHLNPNMEINLYGGMNFATLPYQNLYNSRSAYGGLQLKYTADNGLFLYGQGFASMSSPGMHPLYSRNPSAYYTGFGGGIGYNIPGGMPVSLGVNWVRNPFTQRLEPVAQVNIMGGLIYLIKKLIESFESDGSYSSTSYKKPLEVAKPMNIGPMR